MANSNRNRNDRNYALDKFDADVSSSPKKGSQSKRPKKGGFAAAVFPTSRDSGAEKARKVILIFAVAALIGTVAFLVWQITSMNKGGEVNSSLASIAGVSTPSSSSSYSQPAHIAHPSPSIATSAGTRVPEEIDLTPVIDSPLNIGWEPLKEINSDIKAWISLTGTQLNNPVVQTTDNSYYLDHDFYGNESISGTVFSTYLNDWNDPNDKNKILFGHNMANGDFFAYVMHYVPDDDYAEPLSFYKTHPTIQMATPEGGNAVYKIFAGIIANTESQYGEVFDYITKTRFDSADDFNNYIIEIMDRSWFFTDVDLTYGDELLTLSTCYWPIDRTVDTRWVVFARKVRDGEDPSVNTAVAERNYQAKLFDYYYEVLERYEGWQGSVWDRSKLLSY